MPPRIQLSLLQMLVLPGQKKINLARAETMIRESANQGAEVVLLPEAMDLGWTDPSARTEAGAIPGGETFRFLQNMAESCGVYVCSGLVEKAGEKIFNAAVLISPKGELLLHHRKINELAIGHDLYALGDRVQVAETKWGRIGLMICADGFAQGQVIGRTLGYLGASLILSPSAWAVPSDHDNVKTPYGSRWLENYGPVAKSFRLWIASTSNVGPIHSGPWQGRKCIGCSLVIGPDGQPAVKGAYGEAAESILRTEIELAERPAQGDEWAKFWSDPCNGSE